MAPSHGLQAHTIISTRAKVISLPIQADLQVPATAQRVLYIIMENKAMPRLMQFRDALYTGRDMAQKVRLRFLRGNLRRLAHQ